MPAKKVEKNEHRLSVLACPIRSGENPYCTSLYSEVSRKGVGVKKFSVLRVCLSRLDILHMHWPEHYLQRKHFGIPFTWLMLLVFVFFLWVCRLRKIRLVWTVHNLLPHEGKRSFASRLQFHFFIKQVEGCIFMSEASKQSAVQIYPCLKYKMHAVIPHGHYRNSYLNNVTKKEAGKYLSLPENVPVVVFIGKLRTYKNIPSLIQAFKDMTDVSARLVIAGNPYTPEIESKISEMVENDERIIFHSGFISRDKIQYYLNAADLVALPFAEVHNSGSAILALSFNRPVLVPDKAFFNEFQSKIGKQWIFTYQGKLDSTELRAAIEWSQNIGADDRPDLDFMDWSRIGEQTVVFYRKVARLRHGS